MLNLNLELNDKQDIIIEDSILESMEKAILEVLKEEGIKEEVEVSLGLVDNEEIQRLNREFRNIDSPTDVLSFPLDFDHEFLNTLLLGDIIISVEKAEQQAKEYGHSLERELCYLTVHSTLHLLGYDHMNEEDKKVMRKKEEKVMEILGIDR